MNNAVGIDLGTTFSVVAYVDDTGQPRVIKNRDGFETTPSVVLFEDHTTVVGINAKDQAVLSPDRTVQFVKRQMGNPEYAYYAPDGTQYGAEAISALILRRLKEDAETALGHPVQHAVITVPAYFNDAQRKSTQDAGAIAGLNVMLVINEPTAAALAYGCDGHHGTQTILIYDLGGGTFDVTVMKVSPGNLQVVSTSGNKNLGGFDWDNELINHVRQQVIGQGGIDPVNDDGLMQELREKCEKAKIALSGREKVTIPLHFGAKPMGVEISRATFEDITRGLILQTTALVEQALDDANLAWDAVDKILLVGGSSRMPAVSAEMLKLTGKAPSKELDADLVVAMGAALQAAILPQPVGASYPASPSTSVPVPAFNIADVCSHSLGVVVSGDDEKLYNSIIVHKNSRIPCIADNEYSTVSDNQTEIELQVTQGEDANLDYVQIVGKTTLAIPPHPKGSPIRVRLSYDANGVIEVRMFDLAVAPPTDLGTFVINRTANLGVDEVDALAKRLSSLLID